MMDAIITNVTTTATVIGYPVLAIILFLILWFGTRIFRDTLKICDEMRYERWKRKNAERDWSNIEASWMLELDEYYEEDTSPVQYFNTDTDVIPQIPLPRHDTAELPELSELYNYQEDRK